MSIRYIAECDVCGKIEDHWAALDERGICPENKFFMVNISHVYCTQLCFERAVKIKNGSK